MGHLRIELAQVASASRVFFVASDGTETDVSSIVTKIEVHSEVGGVTRAELHVVKVSGDIGAELAHLLAEEVESHAKD